MKQNYIRALLLLVLLGALLVAACGQQDSPASAAESYVKTRLASDAAKLVALSCKDWEGQARDEAASFQSMNASVDGMSCSQSGEDGQFTLVTCQGKLLTTYAGETRSRDLAARSFKVVKEDGQWKMCGYK